MDELFLIYWDSQDDCCDIAGYILGTEEDAEEFCERTGYDWVRLDRLSMSDAEKIIKTEYAVFGYFKKRGLIRISSHTFPDVKSAQHNLETYKALCKGAISIPVPSEYKIMKRTWTRFKISEWQDVEEE